MIEIMPTKLTERLGNNFSDTIQNRGRAYFMEGSVSIDSMDPDNVEASVFGSDEYAVSILFSLKRIDMYCDCPYMDEYRDACKHLWALLLELDRVGYQPGVNIDKAKVYLDDFDEDEEEDYFDFNSSFKHKIKSPLPQLPQPSWRDLISKVTRSQMLFQEANTSLPLCSFVIKPLESIRAQKLLVEVALKYRKKDGSPGRPESASSARKFLEHGTGLEQQIFSLLMAQGMYSYYGDMKHYIPIKSVATLLSLLESYGHTAVIGRTLDEQWPLKVDKEGNWRFVVDILEEGQVLTMRPVLRRGEESIPLEELGVIFYGDPMAFFHKGTFGKAEGRLSFAWISFFREKKEPVTIAVDEVDLFYESLGEAGGNIPDLSWPDHFWRETLPTQAPIPFFQLEFLCSQVKGALEFEYSMGQNGDKVYAGAFQSGEAITDFKKRLRAPRNLEMEKKAVEAVNSLTGIVFDPSRQEWILGRDGLMENIRLLMEMGIEVLAQDRKKVQSMKSFNLSVSSGIDWFDLEGHASFGDTNVSVLELLNAMQKGDRFVRLSNGDSGLLPEEWLKKNQWLLELGQKQKDDGTIRFHKAHAGAIQGLSEDEYFPAKFDVSSKDFFKKLAGFSGIEEINPSAQFKGTLRDYQKAGLSWLAFLKDFGFGGILADDMGLGKTVQVLALFLHTGVMKQKKPTLVVAPTSLIFNWMDEVNKFAPSLDVVNFTGLARKGLLEGALSGKIILTTYGVLRRDIDTFKEMDFFYVVLDEAQAMKNTETITAKSVRALKADHRLALSGTPVENHLGELWSLKSFLNPGLLWRKEYFNSKYSGKKEVEAEDLEKLRRLVHPFILRRKKEDVLTELPTKSEQIIHCEMLPPQRKLYNEIRDFFRSKVLGHVDSKGINKSRMTILEGLLRLRQVACHPALVRSASKAKSAKLETLMEMVGEAVEEGHKVLIFSQFVTMLDLIKPSVQGKKIPYAYLDGRTIRRKEEVKKFQEDKDCKLFLISLRAGGHGLNLTAASYVFIFDPWWNPAVEAQATDRAHRIGQTQKVFTYRLITKDTVEEKIMALQEKKRELVGSIISGEGSLFKKIGREDIEFLFG